MKKTNEQLKNELFELANKIQGLSYANQNEHAKWDTPAHRLSLAVALAGQMKNKILNVSN